MSRKNTLNYENRFTRAKILLTFEEQDQQKVKPESGHEDPFFFDFDNEDLSIRPTKEIAYQNSNLQSALLISETKEKSSFVKQIEVHDHEVILVQMGTQRARRYFRKPKHKLRLVG